MSGLFYFTMRGAARACNLLKKKKIKLYINSMGIYLLMLSTANGLHTAERTVKLMRTVAIMQTVRNKISTVNTHIIHCAFEFKVEDYQYTRRQPNTLYRCSGRSV